MTVRIRNVLIFVALILTGCLSADDLQEQPSPGIEDPSNEEHPPADVTHTNEAIPDDDDDALNVPSDSDDPTAPDEPTASDEPATGDPNTDQGELLDDAAGPVHVLQAIQETTFKISTADSSELAEGERCVVAAGQRLLLSTPALPADDGRHFLVGLLEPLHGCDLLEGYIFGDHFRIAESPHPIDAELHTTVTAVANTWFKRTEAQSSDLSADDLCALFAGETVGLEASPERASGSHLRVVLASPREGCGFVEGYIYGPHFEVETHVVLTATATTWLKAEAIQSSELADDERCLVDARDLLELSEAPEPAAGDHLRVSLARPRPGCPLRRGYIYGPHFDLGGLALAQNPIEVPYFYQYHNRYEPGGTCGITSGAMLLAAHGSSLTPDDLYRRYGKRQGQSPTGLASIYRRELGYGFGTYAGTRAQIRRHIDEGRPVVIHGNFTRSGHIMLVVGYDDTGWILHDPAGRWAGCYRCGYPSSTSTNGRYVHYSYGAMSASIMGSDGDVWMSVGSTQPL